MSPTLNGSSAIQHFKDSDVIEIRDGITFDFYMGLPHMMYCQFISCKMPSENDLHKSAVQPKM